MAVCPQETLLDRWKESGFHFKAKLTLNIYFKKAMGYLKNGQLSVETVSASQISKMCVAAEQNMGQCVSMS